MDGKHSAPPASVNRPQVCNAIARLRAGGSPARQEQSTIPHVLPPPESVYEPEEHTLDPWTASSQRQTPWRGPRPSVLVAWLALLIVFAGLLVASTMEHAKAAAGSRLNGDVLFEVQAKSLYAARSLPGGGRLDARILAALRDSATTPGMSWRVAAILSEIDRNSDVVERKLLPMVEKFDDEVAALGGDAQTLHEAVKAALVAPDQLAPDQRQRLIDNLGWFGLVLVSHAAGLQNADRLAAEKPAYRVMWVVLLALAGGGLALLVGTILMFWKLVTHLRKYGELRIEMHQSYVPAAVYLEAVAIYLAIALAALVAPGFVPSLGDSMVFSLGLLAVGSVSGVLWPFIRHKSAAEVREDLGLTRERGVWREIGAGIVGYLAILPICIAGVVVTLVLLAEYMVLARQYGWETGMSDGPITPHPVFQWIANGPAIAKVGVLLLASGFAPFFEETMFRGALLNGAARTIRLAPAIVVMAFMFAAIHPQGWFAVPALMSLAVGFALIRLWRRGNLIASMTAHALHNGTVVLIMIVLFG